tara:strand:+ start:24665 stop:26350 length:1686 start_codon:yes stop_codon:yes gene_type:complete
MNKKIYSDDLTIGLVKDFYKENKTVVIFYIIIIALIIPVEIYLFPTQISSLLNHFTNKNKKILNKFENFLPIILSLLLVMSLTLLKRFMENSMIPKFTIFTRKWIFEYIIRKNQNKHELLSIGKIMSILAELPSSARHAVIVFLRSLFPYLIGFIFLTVYFFNFDKKIGILQLVTLVLWILISLFRGKKCIKAFETAQDDVINLYENIQDKFSNLMSIYSSQTEKQEINKHNDDENINEEKYSSSLKCVFYTELYSNILIFISFVAFNYIILDLYRKKKLSLKSISSLYIVEIYYWIIILRRVESNIGEFIHSIGNVKSIEKFISTYNSKEDPINHVSFSDAYETVKFNNVSYKYENSNKFVLKNINFKIYKNEAIWLKGHSGSGKSTIFKMVLGYLKPTNGNISILGKDISNTNVSVLRNVITYVEQDTNLFDSNVYENIVYGNIKVPRNKIYNIIKHLNIKVFDNLPKGLDSPVGILGSNLSGGQKQIILLLRAYFRKNTKILLLDEPISAVDVESVPEILKLISHMKKNKTLIVVSHNNDIEKIITRQIEMDVLNLKS